MPQPINIDVTELYKSFGPIMATIILLVVSVILFVAAYFAHRFIKKIRSPKKVKHVPGDHYSCPGFPDILRLVKEVKDFTESYITKYILRRHVEINAIVNKRIAYLRNQFLRKADILLSGYPTEERETCMRVFRLYTEVLQSMVINTFMKSVKENNLPKNADEWANYKKIQISYNISGMCDHFRAAYPVLFPISYEEVAKFVDSEHIMSEIKAELDRLYDAARYRAGVINELESHNEEELSARIDKILTGGKRGV